MPLLADLIVAYTPISFPKQFTTWIPGKTPFSTLESSFAAIITYLVIIFGIQATLADQPPLKLTRAFQLHNLLLCIASVILLGLSMEEVIPIIWNNGIFHALCNEEGWTPRLEFYYIINYYFKYYELIDTVFLALKKKPLRFLHVYHHAATALLSQTAINSRGVLSWMPVSINLAIHVVMYYYYFRAATGARIWWKKYLTTMQITQFIADVAVLVFAGYSKLAYQYVTFLPHHGNCYGSFNGGFFILGLIISYLYLFVDFYKQTFKDSSTLRKKTEGANKSKGRKPSGLMYSTQDH